MKYNFSINQAAAVELGDVDLVDCAIIEWLRDMCVSTHPRMASARKGGYTWVNYSYAIADMPLLGLNSPEAFRKRLKGILANGYFKAVTHSQKVYVKPTPKMDRLFYSPTPAGPNHQPQLTAPSTVVDGRRPRKTGVNHQPQLTNTNPITKPREIPKKMEQQQRPASPETLSRVRELLASRGIVRPEPKRNIVRHDKNEGLQLEMNKDRANSQKPGKRAGNGQKRGIKRRATIIQLAGVA